MPRRRRSLSRRMLRLTVLYGNGGGTPTLALMRKWRARTDELGDVFRAGVERQQAGSLPSPPPAA